MSFAMSVSNIMFRMFSVGSEFFRGCVSGFLNLLHEFRNQLLTVQILLRFPSVIAGRKAFPADQKIASLVFLEMNVDDTFHFILFLGIFRGFI